MRAVFSFLSLLALLFVFLIIASDSSQDELKHVASSLSRDEAVVAVSTAAPPLFTPVPTPDPNRQGPETTLIEVNTGRSLALWEPGDAWLVPRFTEDNRWLVYDKGPDPYAPLIYRIDLTDPSLTPVVLTHGFRPVPSPDGRYIAFTRWSEDRRSRREGFVLGPDGGIKELPTSADSWSFSWSPDGGYLAYAAPPENDGQLIPAIVLDIETGEERIIGSRKPCQCDSRALLDWSPDGRHLLFEDAELGAAVARIDEWEPRGVGSSRGRPWWLADSKVAVYQAKEAMLEETELVELDIATGATRELPQAFSKETISLDGAKFAQVVRRELPNGETEAFTEIVARDGRLLQDKLPAGWLRWSAEGNYISIETRPEDVCFGISLYNVNNGARAGCLADVPAGLASAWSPTGAVIAYVYRDPPRTPPRQPVPHQVFLFDADSGRVTTLLPDVRGVIMQCVLWSPDERWLVVDDWCDGI